MNLYGAPDEGRQVQYYKISTIKLDTKCLYAGKIDNVKQWSEKPHSHYFCEILFVFSGSGEVFIDRKKYNIKRGDIVIYNPYSTHNEATASPEGFELGFLGITNFKLGNLPFDHLVEKGEPAVLSTGEKGEKFDFYFRSLLAEANGEGQYNEFAVDNWVKLVMIEIFRLMKVSEAKFVTKPAYAKIHKYLSCNFAKIQNIDQVCNALNITKYYITRVFKEYMGVSPMKYVIMCRISHAKKLLKETDLSATQIGEMCGYRDHVLFFKTFKREVGMTPLTFRSRGEFNT